MIDESIKIKGIIVRILSYSLHSGIILVLSPFGAKRDDGVLVKIDRKVTSGLSVFRIGQIWEFTGAYEPGLSREYLLAEFVKIALPSGEELVEFFLENPEFAPIGAKNIKKLWSAFGADLYEIIISQNVTRLLSKVSLSDAIINLLFEKWRYYYETTRILEFFFSIRFPLHFAWKAHELWGASVQDAITDDPYRLLALGAWEQVDKCAQEYFFIPLNSEHRNIAAVESALYEAYDDKHSAQSYDSLVDRLSRIIGEQNLELSIALALADGRVCTSIDSNGSQTYRLAAAKAVESYIEVRIHSIETEVCANGKVSGAILTRLAASLPYKLQLAQRRGIKKIIEKPFAVILGGRSSGKKSLLTCVFSMLPKNAVIMQIALTRQALESVRELTDYDAVSVVEFLKLAKVSVLSKDLHLFIHEASSLDVILCYKIIQLLPEGSRLYLIGDDYQLPPNGPGLFFHKLIMDNHPNIIKLISIVNEPVKNSISVAAGHIRHGSEFELEEFVSGQSKGFGISFLEAESQALVDSLVCTYRELSEAAETQVVSTNQDTCNAINALLHYENISMRESLGLPADVIVGDHVELTVGDRIIFTGRTDHERGLFNGAVGALTEIYNNPVIMEGEGGEYMAFVAEANFNTIERVQLTENDLDYINLGYSISSREYHFGQWKQVIVASEFPDNDSDLVDSRWLYTVIAQCEKQCVVVGSLDGFNFQITKPCNSISRCVGLNFNQHL